MEIYASLYDHAATLLAEQPELAWGWRPAMAFGWDATAVRWRAEPAYFSERMLARRVVSANVTVRVLDTLQWGTYRGASDAHAVQVT